MNDQIINDLLLEIENKKSINILSNKNISNNNNNSNKNVNKNEK